jgi:hypothetical protein
MSETTEELVENLAKASWEASDGFITRVPWPPQGGLRAEKERRRVRAVLAVLSGDFPYIGQRVEWNPTGEAWERGTVATFTDDGDIVRVLLDDNRQYLNVSRRHLRPAA